MSKENIVDRLELYMKYKGYNPNKVTMDAVLSVGLIGKSFKSRKGLHSDTIEKILYAYKDLNPEWFITGAGKMIIETETKNVLNEPPDNYSSCQTIIKKQAKEIKELNREIGSLTYQLDQIKKIGSPTDPLVPKP